MEQELKDEYVLQINKAIDAESETELALRIIEIFANLKADIETLSELDFNKRYDVYNNLVGEIVEESVQKSDKLEPHSKQLILMFVGKTGFVNNVFGMIKNAIFNSLAKADQDKNGIITQKEFVEYQENQPVNCSCCFPLLAGKKNEINLNR